MELAKVTNEPKCQSYTKLDNKNFQNFQDDHNLSNSKRAAQSRDALASIQRCINTRGSCAGAVAQKSLCIKTSKNGLCRRSGARNSGDRTASSVAIRKGCNGCDGEVMRAWFPTTQILRIQSWFIIIQ